MIKVNAKVEAAPSPLVQNGNSASLTSDEGVASTLQKVIETDGVLLTDKEHLEEALRAATYVIPALRTKSP